MSRAPFFGLGIALYSIIIVVLLTRRDRQQPEPLSRLDESVIDTLVAKARGYLEEMSAAQDNVARVNQARASLLGYIDILEKWSHPPRQVIGVERWQIDSVRNAAYRKLAVRDLSTLRAGAFNPDSACVLIRAYTHNAVMGEDFDLVFIGSDTTELRALQRKHGCLPTSAKATPPPGV